MKRYRMAWGAAAALPLLAIGLPLAGCGKKSAAPPQKTGVSAPAPAKATPAATVYTCPMHPEVKSDKPGKCPKCGMTLELKKTAALPMTAPAAAALAVKHAVALQDPETGSGCTMAPCDMSNCPACAAKSGA